MVRTTSEVFFGKEPKSIDSSKPFKTELMKLLNWYNYTCDRAKRQVYVKQYVKQYPFVKYSDISVVPDQYLSNYPHLMRIILNGVDIPEDDIIAMHSTIEGLIDRFKPKKDEKKVVSVNKQDKIADYLSEIDPMLDSIQKGKLVRWSVNTSVNLSAPEKNSVRSYYTKVKEELEWAIDTKAEEYITSIPVLRRMAKFCEDVISSLTIERAPRKAKVKTKEQLVSKVKYLPVLKVGLTEYKSFKPEYIIGAQLVFAYNTKNKMLYRFVGGPGGLSVSNTRIVDYDENKSTGRRLRKPDMILPLLKGKSHNKLNKIFEDLTTKDSRLVDRTNDGLLLVHTL